MTKTSALALAALALLAASPSRACKDAKELETPLELTISYSDGRSQDTASLRYVSCLAEGRNDYLPAYSQRSYEGGIWTATVVTEEGADRSEIIVWRKDFPMAKFTAANAAIASGDPLPASGVAEDAGGRIPVKVSVRNAAKPLYPQLAACEAAISRIYGAQVRDAQGKPVMGMSWYGGGPSLALLTRTQAYYHSESCDICADLDRCDIATGKVTGAVHAHSVSCADVDAFAKGADVLYNACAR